MFSKIGLTIVELLKYSKKRRKRNEKKMMKGKTCQY